MPGPAIPRRVVSTLAGLVLAGGVLAAAASAAPARRPPSPPGPGGGGVRPPLFTMSGQVEGLFPGLPAVLSVTISNPQAYDIVVTAVRVTAGGTDACPATLLSIGSFTGSLPLAPQATTTVEVPIELDAGAPTICQNVTFPLAFVGDAQPASVR